MKNLNLRRLEIEKEGLSPKSYLKTQEMYPVQKVISLYSRGLTTREINEQIQDLYGIEVSAGLVSNITDQIIQSTLLKKGKRNSKIKNMSYEKRYRERTIEYRLSGHTLKETHEVFKVVRSTIQKQERQYKET